MPRISPLISDNVMKSITSDIKTQKARPPHKNPRLNAFPAKPTPL